MLKHNKFNKLIKGRNGVRASKSDESLVAELIDLTSWLPKSTKLNERLYVYINDIKTNPLCVSCNKTPTTFTNFKVGYKKYCSNRKCYNNHPEVKEKTKNTNIEKYGISCSLYNEDVRKKVKETNLIRYGSENVSNCKEIRDKAKSTNLIRYGSENVSNCKEIRDKAKSTNIEKYGVEYYSQTSEFKSKFTFTSLHRYGTNHPSQNEEIKNKTKNTNIEKYGVECVFSDSGIQEKIKTTIFDRYGISSIGRLGLSNLNFKFCKLLESEDNEKIIEYIINVANSNNLSFRRDIANNLGMSESGFQKLLHRLDISHLYTNYNTSYSELELYEFLIGIIDSNIIRNDRTILSGKELDIYIPDYNLAIEFNGVYWHSESMGKDSSYHLDKTRACESKGIQLLHIYDIEWNDPVKKEIWKSIIKSKLGLISEKIPARKCEFKQISNSESYSFFNDNHIQGGLKYGNSIALAHNNIIYCILSYGKSRFKSNEVEIYRFANLINSNVVGGFSKLLKFIQKNINKSIISYANRRFSMGNVYYRTGFILDKETSPNYFYYKDGKIYSRHNFKKHKLKNMKYYDENLTERDIMKLNNYTWIYDSGNLRFELKCQ